MGPRRSLRLTKSDVFNGSRAEESPSRVITSGNAAGCSLREPVDPMRSAQALAMNVDRLQPKGAAEVGVVEDHHDRPRVEQ